MDTNILAWLLVGAISGFIVGVIIGGTMGFYAAARIVAKAGIKGKNGKLYFKGQLLKQD